MRRFPIFSDTDRLVTMAVAAVALLAAVVSVCIPKGNSIACRVCGRDGRQLCQYGICDKCHDRLEQLGMEWQ